MLSMFALWLAVVSAEVLIGKGAWGADRMPDSLAALLLGGPLRERVNAIDALWKKEFGRSYAVVDQLPRRVWRANKTARRAARRAQRNRKKEKHD